MTLVGARGYGGRLACPGVQKASDEHTWISLSSFPRCSTAFISRQFACATRGRHDRSFSAMSSISSGAGAARMQASRTRMLAWGSSSCGTWKPTRFCYERTEGWLLAAAQKTSVASTTKYGKCRFSTSRLRQGPFACLAADRYADAQLLPCVEINGFEGASEDVAGKRAHQSEELSETNDGKSGFVSFYRAGNLGTEENQPVHNSETFLTTKGWESLLWILGPVSLVVSVVVPPLHLRTVSEALLQDSLFTDFVILFFTESCFYAGALVFLYVADKFSTNSPNRIASKNFVAGDAVVYPLGYRVAAAISLALGLLLPIATLVVVWSWTGPAAAAALLPYILGVLVQLSFERITWARNSCVGPVIPIVFQVYRLHQLNRAAQLVAGLLFSLRGAETTAETLAINGALRTLLSVLQLLGILSLWSLASFLSHGLPSGALRKSGTS